MPWDTKHENTAEWKRLRKRILKRDRGICHVCGLPGSDQVDHILNRARGGTDDDSNLAAIHAIPCHRDKTQQEAAAGRATRTRARAPRQHPASATTPNHTMGDTPSPHPKAPSGGIASANIHTAPAHFLEGMCDDCTEGS